MPPFGPGTRSIHGIPRVIDSLPVVRGFADGEGGGYFPPRDFVIGGVSRDSTGAALGGCTVKLYNFDNDQMVASTVSDGSGNYSFTVMSGTMWYVRFYLAGSPNSAGTTDNRIVGT